MKTWIIISIYWIVVVATVYAIRAYNKKKSPLSDLLLEIHEINEKPHFWKRFGTHAAIILLLPLLMPVVIVVFLIDKCLKHNKKKKEIIKDESQYENKYSAKMEENLPDDIYTQVSKIMMDALISGSFDDFEKMLGDYAKTVVYRSRTIQGKVDVRDYWWGWRSRYVLTKKVTNLEVVMSHYYSHACLKVETDQLLLFQIRDGKISKIVSLPLHLTSLYSDDNMLNYPMEYDRIKQFLSPLVESVDCDGTSMPLTNRIPCLHCGTASQDLIWYSIRIPDSFYKDWKLGQVSICPHCGCVVEYKEVKTVESEDEKNVPIEGSKYSDKGNTLSDCADRIIPRDMESVKAENLDSYVSKLMNELTEVSMEQGHRLELRLPVETGSGDRTHILVVDSEGNESEEIDKYLKITPTEMGVWQFYLLKRLYTVLPLWWHGGYNRRKFILRESDIDNIIPLKFHDLTELKNQNKLMPYVTVDPGDANGHSFVVNCCYWNEWEGLVRETVSITIDNSKVKDFRNLSKEVKFQYDCGIRY